MNDIKSKSDLKENDLCTKNCKNYRLLCEVGSGTYGRVFKALCLTTNTNVALKKIDISKQDMDGFPITAIREIKLLKLLDHPNIIKLREIVVSKPAPKNKNRGSTFLVFDYMDHDFVGLKNIKINFTLPQIKCIIYQILQGVKYLHEKKILHRDLKSANILLNNSGEVKIADFGLARQISYLPQMLYTNKVVTLWYRAPEILLGSQDYGTPVDIWSVGCVLVELITGEVLCPGDKESRQIELIYEKCGTPDLLTWPEAEKYRYFSEMKPKVYIERKLKQIVKQKKRDLDESTLDLIDKLLVLNPKFRITAEEALRHDCFSRAPLPCSLEEMPKIEKECHEGMFKERIKKFNQNLRLNNQKIQFNQNKNLIYNNFYESDFFGKNATRGKPPKNIEFMEDVMENSQSKRKNFKNEQSITNNNSNNNNHFLLSEKDNELHFQSDHSNKKSPKPTNNETNTNNLDSSALEETNFIEKKDLDNSKPGGGLSGLKSLISINKATSPKVEIKKENDVTEEKTKKIDELDQLFIKNYEVQKKKGRRNAKRKNLEEYEAPIEKKIKVEKKNDI